MGMGSPHPEEITTLATPLPCTIAIVMEICSMTDTNRTKENIVVINNKTKSIMLEHQTIYKLMWQYFTSLYWDSNTHV